MISDIYLGHIILFLYNIYSIKNILWIFTSEQNIYFSLLKKPQWLSIILCNHLFILFHNIFCNSSPDIQNWEEAQKEYYCKTYIYQQLKYNVGSHRESLSTELFLEIEICQEMDHTHILPQIIYMRFCIVVFPSILYDSL